MLRTFQNLASHRASDGRKAFQKFFEGIVVFEIIKKGFDGNTRAFEHGCAAKNFRINCDQIVWIHGGNVTEVYLGLKPEK